MAVSIDTSLIPTEVQQAVIEGVVNQSVALSLGTKQNMPVGAEVIPVLGSLPTAGWTSIGGRKPIASMSWTSQVLKAEEVAATINVPQAYLDDVGFPLWEEIQPRMVEALSYVIDEAILFGTNAPSSFPAGGILASSIPAELPASPENDLPGLFNDALSRVENEGMVPNGIGADVSLKGKMRGARMTTGEPLFVPNIAGSSPDQIFGLPVSWARGGAFNTAFALAFGGDWSMLRLGIRRDITVDMSEEGVLFDPSGNVVVSAFQDDQVLMRIHMRLGCVIGRPISQRAPNGAFPWSHLTEAALPGSAVSSRTVTVTTALTTTLLATTGKFYPSDVGAAVTGTGIPAATTIAEWVDSTHVVMSAAGTAAASGITATITG